MPSQFARGSILPPRRSQSLPAAPAIEADIALHARHRHAHDLRRLFAFQSTMQQPHDPSPSPHASVRVRLSLTQHGPLFCLCQCDPQPCHDPPPCENPNGHPDHQRNLSEFRLYENISLQTARGIKTDSRRSQDIPDFMAGRPTELIQRYRLNARHDRFGRRDCWYWCVLSVWLSSAPFADWLAEQAISAGSGGRYWRTHPLGSDCEDCQRLNRFFRPSGLCRTGFQEDTPCLSMPPPTRPWKKI